MAKIVRTHELLEHVIIELLISNRAAKFDKDINILYTINTYTIPRHVVRLAQQQDLILTNDPFLFNVYLSQKGLDYILKNLDDLSTYKIEVIQDFYRVYAIIHNALMSFQEFNPLFEGYKFRVQDYPTKGIFNFTVQNAIGEYFTFYIPMHHFTNSLEYESEMLANELIYQNGKTRLTGDN